MSAPLFVLLAFMAVFALNRLQYHKALEKCERLAASQAVELADCRENPMRALATWRSRRETQ